MIIAEQKSLPEIDALIKDARKVLVVGCGGCVSVCLSGGQAETEVLAAALRLKRKVAGVPIDIREATLERQCDPEYIAKLDDHIRDADCILSLACGVGVQFLAERYADTVVIPAQDTKFAGGTTEHGVWEERCGLCGDCVLATTGGICPVIRCAKSLFNGPCGGSHDGKCEVSEETPCAWCLIYERMKRLGREADLYEIQPPKDWSKARDGGLRKVVRGDLQL
ncbi:MAG: methylenetetrahydrofolate reductase C-terminal domain-containing protein [Negativicutes bacterium]|nr:methylenetetrahydrofolate reductase C-terminal domain-containing protein [Negativicutes bacterium]